MHGDWGGQVLLLAKDLAPSRVVRERIAAGDPRPYRHEPRMRANRVLVRLAAPLESAGLLYGSALANLLREDGRLSGPLPNRAAALAYGAEVLRFVVAHMPRLRWVACMGAEAWECGCAALGLSGDWEVHRDACEPLGPLVAAYHPSARVSREEMARAWEMLGSAACVRPSRRAIETDS